MSANVTFEDIYCCFNSFPKLTKNEEMKIEKTAMKMHVCVYKKKEEGEMGWDVVPCA